MRYKAILTHDHDQKVKLDQEQILCYSKKQLDQLDPQGGYTILGETSKGNSKVAIGQFLARDSEFTVSEFGKHSRITNRVAGYVRVGQDEYLAILKSRWPFILLLLALLGILAVLIAMLLKGPEIPVIQQEHPLPEQDHNAVIIDPDSPLEPEEEEPDHQQGSSEEGGGSVSMIYTLEAKISLATKEISMYFKNPTASTHDVVCELYVISDGKEYRIAKSGRIPAGYELSTMTYTDEAAILSEGMYSGKYKVQCYDPKTGEMALVAPEITDVSISVK